MASINLVIVSLLRRKRKPALGTPAGSPPAAVPGTGSRLLIIDPLANIYHPLQGERSGLCRCPGGVGSACGPQSCRRPWGLPGICPGPAGHLVSSVTGADGLSACTVTSKEGSGLQALRARRAQLALVSTKQDPRGRGKLWPGGLPSRQLGALSVCCPWLEWPDLSNENT